eukprot:TRINITY_DN2830_c0_g1_i1.p1 TRINITY_DN2830_c0_g1~~TRINITY_DN2830_c0_g1_i1.p1  ORF type:complete len:455 (-),score=81.91 TRINITY_DN2830_c0_g1_i1:39-1403(-)
MVVMDLDVDLDFLVIFVAVSFLVYFAYCTFGMHSGEKRVRLLPPGWERKIEAEYPPFAVKTLHNKLLIVGGGGGESNTGVPNQLVLYRMREGMLRARCVVDTGKKTVFQIAYHPTLPIICCSVGLDCWIMRFSSRGIQRLCSFTTTDSTAGRDPEQKTCCFVKNGQYLVTAGSDGVISFYAPAPDYSSVQLVSKTKAFEGEKRGFELRDCSVTSDCRVLMATSKQECKVWKVEDNISLGEPALTFKPDKGKEFAQCRLTPSGQTGILSEILPRKASTVRIISLGARSYDSVTVFSGKHHTAMDMSDDGRLLAFGNAVGEVAVVSVTQQQLIMPPTSAHGYCITGITVCNPNSALPLPVEAQIPTSPARPGASPSKRGRGGVGAASGASGGGDAGDGEEVQSPFTISCALDRSVTVKLLEDHLTTRSSLVTPTAIVVTLLALLYQGFLFANISLF